MAGPIKSVFTSIGSLFGGGEKKEAPATPVPPAPPATDNNADAAAAAARTRAAATPDNTTYAGELGDTVATGGKRGKRLLGF